jgi:crotonobetainyl-CoA:carnitine CoA-transferase CaiB-like acyl-CoA transferase
MPAPLEGIRVLDTSTGMSGAVAATLLADYGADVLRIATAGDDRSATRPWNRGKRIARFDPGRTGHRDRIIALASGADVVMTGPARGGPLPAVLGPDAVGALRADLVHLALSAYGLDADRPTAPHDPLVAAETGVMVTADPLHRDGPVYLGHPAIAFSTAMVAVIGTLAAVRRRIVSGRGDTVDASILDGILAQSTMNWWTRRDVAFLASRRPDGQLDLGRTRMLVRRFTCRDGRVIQVHTGAAGAFGRLMTLLGVDRRISPATTVVENATPLSDHDLAVLEELPAIFAERSSDAWLRDIWANDIAALPVLRPAECFDDDQVRASGLIRAVDDPELGEIEVVGPPVQMSRTPALHRAPDVATPLDGVDWMAGGLPPGGAEPCARGPLDGIRVVEFSTFFASPYANRLLRDLGADVIKVEAPSGDPMRGLADPFEGASHGKRSIVVDLKDPAARPIVDALLASADVVQQNFRPGVAERLALDDATVRSMNPTVIYDYAPGYGSTGPKSGLQSFAPLQSGFVGIHAEGSGEGNVPTLTFGNEDYYNGLLNAIATLLALVHRDRTGDGQLVEGSQLSSSVYVTSHWFKAGAQRRSVLPRLDRDQLGWSPYQRLYQCLEGWICVHCTDDDQQTELRTIVLGRPDAPDPDALANALAHELYGRPADAWVADLRHRGVPCAVVVEDPWLTDHLADPAEQAAGRASAFSHHQHGEVSVIGRIVRLGSQRPLEPARAPLLGEHTTEILDELRLGDGSHPPVRRDEVAAPAVEGAPT